jgi:hypothetical protein
MAPPRPPRPVRAARFRSSSGRTAIQYYRYRSGVCGAGPNCNFRGVIRVGRGFDQVEVFLCGLTLMTGSQVDKVGRVSATVNKYNYDATTGDLEVGVSALFATQGQTYSYELTFVVLLTDASAANFSPVSTGCGGVDTCTISQQFVGAVPPNMHYIGLGTRNWDLGSNGPAVPINAVSGHISGLTLAGADVNVDYYGVFRDAAGGVQMFLEWGAAAIAFLPSEMAQNASPIFPQYTTVGTVSTRQAWIEHDVASVPITGLFNALEGLTFFYGAGQEHELWMIEASVSNVRVPPGSVNMAQSDWGIFLGTTFGDRINAFQYTFQESRAVGFLL